MVIRQAIDKFIMCCNAVKLECVQIELTKNHLVDIVSDRLGHRVWTRPRKV